MRREMKEAIDAGELMEAAKSDLKRFQKELKDVNIPLDLRMEVGSQELNRF